MPALALAQAFIDAGRGIEPVLVGAARGIEADVLPRYPFRHHLLPIEPIYRRTWWKNLRWLLIANRVWRAVGRVLEAEHPAIVIGTGGYAAGPVVWLARRARQIHLGFPEARARLAPGPTTQVFTLGNPVRPPEPGPRESALGELGLGAQRPTLLVFGGSQGARAINYAVAGALERRLLDDVNVLWGTGLEHADALARYAAPGRVVIRGFFDPMTVPYRAADVVVARAGAMTVAELCAWGKPSILVPLPSAAADHQAQNARALAEAGAAIHLPERDLTAYALADQVSQLLGDRTRLESVAARARARGNPNAAREIVSKILTVVA
jgi:UDP-N-acetylglucosamine--N-acetylmuramyl-(pentapeptide) pyrophosphoryl-undecaprenol N-acetylglucosamine transferase